MSQRDHTQPPTRLHPDDLKRLAREVAAELDASERPLATQRLVDANELARLLSVTPRWVREHAALLGGQRLPSGKDTPRWRFDPQRARAALAATEQPAGRPRSPSRPRRRRPRSRSTIPLLPVREDK